MMRWFSSRSSAVALAALCGAGLAAAQPPAAQTPPLSLSRGWAALEQHQFAQAIAAADAALAAFPHNHSAAVLKVAALAASGKIPAAFDTARTSNGGRLNDDRHLLGVIAEYVLRDLGTSARETAVRVRALSSLAAAGDRASRAALTQLGGAGGLERDEALASVGDAAAAVHLVEAIQSMSGSRRAAAIAAAGHVGAPGAAAAIRPLLENTDAAIRSAAADALGEMKDAAAADALVPLLSDQMPDVRRGAALALRRIGRGDGDLVIASMLGSGVPDIVLGIAEGMPDDVARWQAEVEPLLHTENPIDRLRAARLLQRVLPEASSAVIHEALADGNVAIREEAGRALGDVGVVGPNPEWPTLLADPSPWVRVEAARALLLDVTK